MKRAFAILSLGTILFATAAQATVTVTKESGHTNGLSVKVTTKDGTVIRGILNGVGHPYWGWHTHKFSAQTPAASMTSVWLDTIAQIRDTTDEDMQVVMRSGTIRRLRYARELTALSLITVDDGSEHIDFAKVEKVEFLKPCRRDKLNFAMFDHWKYSANTGERLPNR